MSQFDYLADGKLDSNYLIELIKEYLDKLSQVNDTNGIVDDDYKINPNANKFARWFNSVFKQVKFKFNKNANRDNYYKVLTNAYVQTILDKIQIYMQTQVLEARQFFELTSTLKAIKFDVVVPILEEYRYRAIKTSQRKLANTIQDAKYLKYARSNYILYNSPVHDLKPFLSKKVTEHTIDYTQLQTILKQYINVRYSELIQTDFEPYKPEFKTDINEFYNETITSNAVGEEVEEFIRSKMHEKLEIQKSDDRLVEDINKDISQIDLLLKRLKVGKIEQMLQELVKYKYDLSRVAEVVELCKDTINSTTIPNKAQIFLLMDNLYYKLSKKCEILQLQAKSKIQKINKQKLFNTLDMLQNPQTKASKKNKSKIEYYDSELDADLKQLESIKNKHKANSITSNLYDDDDEDSEIDISEDGGSDNSDDEIIID